MLLIHNLPPCHIGTIGYLMRLLKEVRVYLWLFFLLRSHSSPILPTLSKNKGFRHGEHLKKPIFLNFFVLLHLLGVPLKKMIFWTLRSGNFGKIMISLNFCLKIFYTHVDRFFGVGNRKEVFPYVSLYVYHLFQQLFSYRKICF
jgi:hypothetical protein